MHHTLYVPLHVKVQARVKGDVLQALRDANCDIRNTAAILIGTRVSLM